MKCDNELESKTSQAESALRTNVTDVYPDWFIDQKDWVANPSGSQAAIYNFPLNLRIRGPLDCEVLKITLSEILRRHEILRSSFAVRDGLLYQSHSAPCSFVLRHGDLSHLPETQAVVRARELVKEEMLKAFDFSTGPFLRGKLLRVAEEDYILALAAHHLVFDDWSVGVFVREFTTLYQAFSKGEPSPLGDVTFSYRDFLAWRRKMMAQSLKTRLTFWKKHLGGATDYHHFVPDRSRPSQRTSRGGWETLVIPPQLVYELRTVGQREGVTMFMTLLAAFQVLLHRHSGDVDIGVGTCAANRAHLQVEGLIGRFGNDLVLHTSLADNPTFRELLKRVRRTALEGFTHQDVPFGQLVQELAPVRDRGRNPLFQTMFILRDAPKNELKIPNLDLSWFEVELGTAKYDLNVWIDLKESLEIGFEYNRDLFEPVTMRGLLDSYSQIMKTVALNPGIPVSELVTTSPALNQIKHEVRENEPNYLDARDVVEMKLVELWQQIFSKQPIGIKDNFFQLGGGSLLAAQLCASLERSFNKKLEIGAIFEAPTIEQLANVIRAAEIEHRTIRVIPLQPGGSRPPFFCTCLFVGSGPIFLPLTRYLGTDQPFYGLVPSESLANKLTPPYNLTDVAQHIADTIRRQQAEGPYFLGGFCGDGVLAYETARLLRTQGEEIGFLALFEAQTREKQKEFHGKGRQLHSVAQRFAPSKLKLHLGRLWKAGFSGSKNYLVRRGHDLIRDLNDILWQVRIGWKLRLQSGKLHEMREILFIAEAGYDPPRYDGNVAVFRCTDYRATTGDDDRGGGWDKVVNGSLSLHEIRGDHLGILDEPNVQILAEKLSNCLRSAGTSMQLGKVQIKPLMPL